MAQAGHASNVNSVENSKIIFGPTMPGKHKNNGDKESESEESESEESDDGQQRSKILKAVSFPEVEKESSAASAVVKVSKCIQKRLQKLSAQMETFEGMEKKDATQSAFLGITCFYQRCKWTCLSWRHDEKTNKL